MARTVSATDARHTLGELLDALAATGEPVVIERHGAPAAVLIAADEYARLQRLILEHGLADYRAAHPSRPVGQ